MCTLLTFLAAAVTLCSSGPSATPATRPASATRPATRPAAVAPRMSDQARERLTAINKRLAELRIVEHDRRVRASGYSMTPGRGGPGQSSTRRVQNNSLTSAAIKRDLAPIEEEKQALHAEMLLIRKGIWTPDDAPAQRLVISELGVGKHGVVSFGPNDRSVVSLEVMQVTGPSVMLCKFAGKILMIKGMATDGLVDGSHIDLLGHFIVSGTRTYTTALGTSNTVFVMEPYAKLASQPYE